MPGRATRQDEPVLREPGLNGLEVALAAVGAAPFAPLAAGLAYALGWVTARSSPLELVSWALGAFLGSFFLLLAFAAGRPSRLEMRRKDKALCVVSGLCAGTLGVGVLAKLGLWI
jgi:hypothetical protein